MHVTESANACHLARPVFLIAILIAAASGALAAVHRASADGGVPIPAPAGTQWSVVAGYNTGTHSVADGHDPHALDLVRLDASTDWTPVLAPVDGVVTWFDGNGVSIVDERGYAHLLVHIDTENHLHRGLSVSVGDQIGRVFPVGYDINGGVAHIHYAIHVTSGGGYLDHTIPFTGTYALEGRDLPWADEYNLYLGEEFTSTNSPNRSAPTDDQPPVKDNTEPTTPVNTPHPEPVWTVPADAPRGGWRTVGVPRNTSVAGLFSLLQAPLVELRYHDAVRNTYHRFDPVDSASADVAVRSLAAGRAVWALVEPDAQWIPAPTAEPKQVTIPLSPGPNLISWQGPQRQISEALRNVAHLSHAYRYDPYTGNWQFWSLNGPALLDSLITLNPGDALYIHVRIGSTWTQLP